MVKSGSNYEEALSILMERFPILGLQALSWQPVESDPAFDPIDPGLAEVLYCYGFGDGSVYFAYQKWLQGDPTRKLVFLEDEPGVIASFLANGKAVEIFSDEQVYLEIFSGKRQEIRTLANRFPKRRIEIISMTQNKRKMSKMRLPLLRMTALSYAMHLDRLHGYQPFENFLKNSLQIGHSFYANRLQGAFENTPAVVCGAGPSLQRSLETLKTLEDKALIVAGGSTIAALSSQGILPHFGVAVDPNLEEYRRLKNSFAFEVPLLYSTRVHPAIFQTCNGPFGYMRSGIGGVAEVWLEEELGLTEPFIGADLPPESISVTLICVAWAQFLGCNPILLNGVDLAYTANRRYADGVGSKEELVPEAIEREKSAADRLIRRRGRDDKMVYTAVRWIMEANSLSRLAKKHRATQMLNTTEGGLPLRGIADASLQEVSRHFCKQPLRQLVQQKVADAYFPPDTASNVAVKLQSLRQSLDRLIHYLKIITKKEKGSAALAELELEGEMATLYLFYDIRQIFPNDARFWENWLELALKYQLMFFNQG